MKKSTHKEISVGFVALGCPKNIVDSEKMLANIGQAGFVLSNDVNDTDIIVINTCGFIAPAKEEALDEIRQAVKQKKKGRIKKVIVTGCLAQRMGQTLRDEVPEIDAIVGLGQRDDIASIIKDTLENPEPYSNYLEPAAETEMNDSERLLLTPRHWTYLRISEGYDRKCAFCTIPSIRGHFRSKPQDAILAEATELVANGAVELNIIAQDSNYYGRDMNIKDGLVKLLAQLETIDRLKWIRLMYLYPSEISDELIAAIATSQKIVNYIDMPIQHINDQILRNMRRSDRKEKTMALIDSLRNAMPDVALRTTIIAGLPGETDEQFAELLDFVKWARFDALGCFTYYPEQGTPAAEMDAQVPEETKIHRADKIMLAQQKIAFEKANAKIGKEITLLVDSIDENNTAIGRSYAQAPEIDSVCLIENSAALPGQFINAKVTATKDYDLITKQINS